MTRNNGYTQGFRDGQEGIQQEMKVPWDHPYAQGYSHGWSAGNCCRLGFKDIPCGDGQIIVIRRDEDSNSS